MRDHVFEAQGRWINTLAGAAQIAVDEGHFRADTDIEQFAFEVYSFLLGFQFFQRMMKDPHSVQRKKAALEGLICRYKK